MARIFKRGTETGDAAIRDFVMTEFGDQPPAGRTAPAFVPDRPVREGAQQAEFILGGFDFSMAGGLRREEILSRSMDEAKALVEQAKSEAAAIREKARKEGHAQGHKQGYDKGLADAALVGESFATLVGELTAVRTLFYERAEFEMIDLVTAIARTVFGLQAQVDPALVQKVIVAAVEQLQAREEMTIKVNPDDLAEAGKVLPDLARRVENIEKVHFYADPMITRGGCVVETTIGSIDARIETQLESIRESFVTALAEARSAAASGAATTATPPQGA